MDGPVLIRRDASDSPSPRVPASESISSMKMIDGFASRAIWKSCLTSLRRASASDRQPHPLPRQEHAKKRTVHSLPSIC